MVLLKRWGWDVSSSRWGGAEDLTLVVECCDDRQGRVRELSVLVPCPLVLAPPLPASVILLSLELRDPHVESKDTNSIQGW